MGSLWGHFGDNVGSTLESPWTAFGSSIPDYSPPFPTIPDYSRHVVGRPGWDNLRLIIIRCSFVVRRATEAEIRDSDIRKPRFRNRSLSLVARPSSLNPKPRFRDTRLRYPSPRFRDHGPLLESPWTENRKHFFLFAAFGGLSLAFRKQTQRSPSCRLILKSFLGVMFGSLQVSF